MRLRKRHSVLPGFGLTMGFTLVYLALIVLVPLSTLFWKSATSGAAGFWQAVTAPRVVASYRLTLRRVARGRASSTRCSGSSSPGCWCATASRAGG